jgi:hypothetical protein
VPSLNGRPIWRGSRKCTAAQSAAPLEAAIAALDDSAFRYFPIYPELRGQNANRAYLEAELE